MNFPERLKYLRKYYGYTQSTLAEKLGVTQGTVAMWETGKRRKCSVTNRRKRICHMNKWISFAGIFVSMRMEGKG